MEFIVFRCKSDPAMFVVTDAEHADRLPAGVCPESGEMERVGEFPEIGESREAFNETIAKNSIAEQGFYRFTAKTFDWIQRPPSAYAPSGGAA
jgi:hypothetical protein